MDVGTWLRSFGFDQHAAAFEENGVDAALLRELTNEDLKDLGVTRLAERKRLLKAIADLSALTDETLGAASSAERRQLSVMFCDLVGSTELSTRLDPEEFGNVIRSYQDACTNAVAGHGGTVAKYMGDGVLVYFGYPRAQEDDAERAVNAGLAVVDAVGDLAADATPLRARVGIATGLVVVGEQLGEGMAQEQAAVGETPNLAARLESLAQPGTVVISDTTYRLTGRRFRAEDLGRHTVKGFAEPVQAWHVTGIDTDVTRFEATRAAGGLTPLVGREREIELLIDCWNKARAGRGQVVLLSGEAGIGKSRVARALQEHLEGEPHIRLRYNCSPQHTNSALYPIVAQLKAASGFARDDTVDQRFDKLETVLAQSTDDARAVAPVLAALMSLPSEHRYGTLEMEPQEQKEATFAVLEAQLDGLTAREPVAMYLEDLHWVDPTTLELFDRLVHRIESLPVLLLVTFRPEFEVPWTPDESLHAIALNRLGRSQVARVIDGITGGQRLPDDVVEEIHARTDGVPLFVEELTKSLLESGLLRDEGTRYAIDGSIRDLRVPATLQESLLARLDRLAPIKEVAQVGAALGRTFSHSVLSAVVGLPETQLRDALVQLEDAELLFRRGRPPEATYRFKHALVQDAAYQSMLRSTRAQLHNRIARVLQEQFPDSAEAAPDQLAHHLSEAGETDAAIAAWRRAAQRAVDLAALAEAEAQLRRALDLLQSLPEDADRASNELDLRIEFGQVLMATKGYMAVETEQNFAHALDLCEEVGAIARTFPVLYGRWSSLYASGQVRSCKELAERILRLAKDHSDDGVLALAHRVTGTASMVCGNPKEGVAHFRRGLALYDPDRHVPLAKRYGQDVGISVQCGLSLALWHLGLLDEARSWGNAAIERARQLGHANTLAYALVHVGCALPIMNQDWETAQNQTDELSRLATDHDMGMWRLFCDMAHAAIRARQNPGAAHNSHLRQTIAALGEQIKFEVWTPVFLCWLAEAQAAAGQVTEGMATLDEVQNRIDTWGERWALSEVCRLHGVLLLTRRDNDPAEAVDCLRQAMRVSGEMEEHIYRLRAATNLAEYLRDEGDASQARAVLQPVYGAFTEGFDQPIVASAQAVLDTLP